MNPKMCNEFRDGTQSQPETGDDVDVGTSGPLHGMRQEQDRLFT